MPLLVWTTKNVFIFLSSRSRHRYYRESIQCAQLDHLAIATLKKKKKNLGAYNKNHLFGSVDSWFKCQFLKYMMEWINTYPSGLLHLSLATPVFETLNVLKSRGNYETWVKSWDSHLLHVWNHLISVNLHLIIRKVGTGMWLPQDVVVSSIHKAHSIETGK